MRRYLLVFFGIWSMLLVIIGDAVVVYFTIWWQVLTFSSPPHHLDAKRHQLPYVRDILLLMRRRHQGETFKSFRDRKRYITTSYHKTRERTRQSRLWIILAGL